MTHSSGNTNKRMYLDSVLREDVDIRVKFKTDKGSVGGTMYQYLLGRRNISNNHEYLAQSILRTNGTVALRLVKLISGSETAITTEYTIPELIHTPDTYINVRLQISGTNPTTIRAKTWGEGWKEPPDWQVTVTDSQAELQTAGSVGIRSFIGSAASNLPVVYTYDSLTAGAPDNTTTASLTGSYANKGVNWHMGAWYTTHLALRMPIIGKECTGTWI